jgi:hypothetical protein
MNWTKVESSQIAEVGYGEGLYGPETLALRFPPTKKQKAAGEPGSEYHYQNVTPEMHQEFMAAESIGSYFGRNIRPFPEKYPFTKVEADPTAPTAEPPSAKNSAPAVGNDDTPSPGSAVALIDDMADDKLFSPGSITDAQLATMRSDWLAEAKKYDISTDKARTELKRFARPLQKLRTGIEARAKELTGATKRKIAAIDTEKRRLVLVVGGIEEEVLSPLTEWEQEEESRKQRLAGRVQFLANMGQVHLYTDIAMLETGIAELEAIDTSTMQEFKVGAESAIAASLKVLKSELERRKAAEMMREELESLRAADAKRQDDERIAAAAKKLADEQVQAAVEKAREETRIELTTSPAPTMEEIADGPQAFVYQEIPQTSSPVYSSAQPQTQGGIVETHEQRINAQAVAAFMGHCGYTRQQAIAGLTAITKRLIPHVSITY